MAFSEKLAKNTFDIFPNKVTETIVPVEYYKSNNIIELEVNPFIMGLDLHNVVHYYRRYYQGKYVKHARFVSKESSTLHHFQPNMVNFQKVAAKLKRPLRRGGSVKKEAGFTMRNRYLVKANFTFGQRTVAAGTAHVYQLLNVPLLFFLKERKFNKKTASELVVKERFFPHRDLGSDSYARVVLEPNKTYRVPPGTTYFVFNLNYNLFAVDIIDAASVCPPHFVDPVMVRANRIIWTPPITITTKRSILGEDCNSSDDENDEDIYTNPPPTPFIGASSSTAAAATSFYSNYHQVDHHQQQQQQQQQQVSFEGQPAMCNWLIFPVTPDATTTTTTTTSQLQQQQQPQSQLQPDAITTTTFQLPSQPQPPDATTTTTTTTTFQLPPSQLQPDVTTTTTFQLPPSQQQSVDDASLPELLSSDVLESEIQLLQQQSETEQQQASPEPCSGNCICKRTVMMSSPEFVKQYRDFYKFKIYDQPEADDKQNVELSRKRRERGKLLPFDLTTPRKRKTRDEDVGEILNEYMSKFQKEFESGTAAEIQEILS